MRRILFVDDEPPILDALRGRLHRFRNEWETTFVDSGEKALQEMERNHYDVVVSDMRMPHMDGAELLKQVAKRWPSAVRIVLSGYAEETQILRLVPVAHQYLSKPCEPQQLENVVTRCIGLQTLLQKEEIRALVGRMKSVPSVPKVFAQLQEIMQREDSKVTDVAHVISSDPALAAKVLQVVNSAFFRIPREIVRIDQAVAYLGFTAIRNLVLSLEVFSSWPAAANELLDANKLIEHMQDTASAARSLAADQPFADNAMLAGLLHDIGYSILVTECPEDLQRAKAHARRHHISMQEAEREIIGATHAEVGAYLLGLWGLPYPVVEAVAHHHDGHILPIRQFDMLSVVCIAHELVPHQEDAALGIDDVDPKWVTQELFRDIKTPYDWNEAVRRCRQARSEA